MQTVSASTDYLLTYYIPVSSELDGNLLDKDGMRLHKAIVYTYYSEPESAISSITQKYIINTPHKTKESEYMHDYNINLANIKGLKVDLYDYGSKECRVVMDSSKIVSEYPAKVLTKVLNYVKKATKLNMKEHKINCTFKEIKAPNKVNSLLLPKALNLEQSSFSTFNEFTSNIAHVPFLYSIFYPLGYSSDGKIAYVKEYDTDPADMVLIRTFVQDLVSDKIVWQDEYRVEENISNIDFKSFWRERHVTIANKLKQYKIKPFKNLKFEPKYYTFKNNTFLLNSVYKSSFRKDWGKKFLDSSSITLGTKNLGIKTIDSRVYTDEHILARKAIGFIPLGESDRVAVVVANIHRGWEGPPHNLSYDIVGASLKVGFK
jgi:hypothetical protein